jgi:hypothetical protein
MNEQEFEALFTKPGVIDWKQIMRAAFAYGLVVLGILMATYALAKPKPPETVWYCYSRLQDRYYPCRENTLWVKDL